MLQLKRYHRSGTVYKKKNFTKAYEENVISVIKILIALNLITLISALSCHLNLRDPKWSNDWHVLVIKVSDNNRQLLRRNTVAANSDLFMFCNKVPHVIAARCLANGEFRFPLHTSGTQSDSLQPVIVQKKESYCSYDLYSVGFNIKVFKINDFHEAYQVCFDRQHMRPLFVINKAYPNADNRPKSLKFNPDEIFYGPYFNAFNWGATFARFQRLLGNNQRYMNRTRVDHIIDRGHMAPSGDFITTNLKRASFKMINVMPQFNTIDNGNWRAIENWARHPSRAGDTICTGVLDCNLDSETVSHLNCVLQLKGKDDKMVAHVLADNRKIPIPLWTYKILKRQSLVFLTMNNIYHEGTIRAPVEFCDTIPCPNSVGLESHYCRGPYILLPL